MSCWNLYHLKIALLASNKGFSIQFQSNKKDSKNPIANLTIDCLYAMLSCTVRNQPHCGLKEWIGLICAKPTYAFKTKLFSWVIWDQPFKLLVSINFDSLCFLEVSFTAEFYTLVAGDRWHMTSDTWQVTHDMTFCK